MRERDEGGGGERDKGGGGGKGQRSKRKRLERTSEYPILCRLERAYCLHPYAPFLLWLCAQAGKKKAVGFGAMSVENVEKSTAASPGTGQKRVLF
jgi:hypothetical protein